MANTGINSILNLDEAEDFELCKKYRDNKMFYIWKNGETCGDPDNFKKDEHFPDCFVNDNLKRKRYKIEEVKEIIKQIK